MCHDSPFWLPVISRLSFLMPQIYDYRSVTFGDWTSLRPCRKFLYLIFIVYVMFIIKPIVDIP